MPAEVPITDAQRRYLSAFEAWLHNVWAKGVTGAAAAATPEGQRKDRALAELRTEASPQAAREAA